MIPACLLLGLAWGAPDAEALPRAADLGPVDPAQTKTVEPAEVALMIDLSRAGQTNPKELRVRILQELGSRGLEVGAVSIIELAAEASQLQATIRAKAEAEAAKIGLLVAIEPGAVSVTVFDRTTGKFLSRKSEVEQGQGLVSLTALAAAELVEASLIEHRMVHTTMPRKVPAPKRAVLPAVKPAGPRFNAAMEVGVTWPIHMRIPFLASSIALGLRPLPRWQLAIYGKLPLSPLFDRDRELVSWCFGLGIRSDIDLLPQPRYELALRTGLLAAGNRVDPRGGVAAQSFWTGGTDLGLRFGLQFGSVGFHLASEVFLPFLGHRYRLDGEPLVDLRTLWLQVSLGVSLHW